MTNLITEARELCEKATPGPWEVVGKDAWRIEGFPQVEMNTPDGKYFPVHNDTDAAFIARSRTLIPELCDALERYKSFAERISKLPDCNDCASNRDCPYLPNWGATARINCPLHKLLPATPKEAAEHDED